MTPESWITVSVCICLSKPSKSSKPRHLAACTNSTLLSQTTYTSQQSLRLTKIPYFVIA